MKLQSHRHTDFVHLIAALWKLSTWLLWEILFLPHPTNTCHYFSTLLSFSLKLQLKVLSSTESRLAREMGTIFVIGVNNMISIILILTLYFFNLTSEYSNCICHHFTVHNCITHPWCSGHLALFLHEKSKTESNVEIVQGLRKLKFSLRRRSFGFDWEIWFKVLPISCIELVISVTSVHGDQLSSITALFQYPCYTITSLILFYFLKLSIWFGDDETVKRIWEWDRHQSVKSTKMHRICICTSDSAMALTASVHYS